MAREYDSDISYEIKAMVGTIGTKKNGWRKELNIVSWNGAPPKFDIRDWSPDHMHMSKGVTLYMDEIRQLVRIFNNFSTAEPAIPGTRRTSGRRTRHSRRYRTVRRRIRRYRAGPHRIRQCRTGPRRKTAYPL